MDSTELLDTWRNNVSDTRKPYLWSDEEAFRYMGDAYRMFVRLTGGIADFTSVATEVPVLANDMLSDLHPSILRIMNARKRSDGREVEIINSTDIGRIRSSDYGQIKQLALDNTTGPVRYMMIGTQKNVARWIQVPEVDDIVDLTIYRLPLNEITGEDRSLDEVEDEHHFHLTHWMEHLAYLKKDAETYDLKASTEAESRFREYCAWVRAEIERYKHKTRVVTYGGL